ncbi:hypothetical protein Hanom_Chr06g00543111 [Helianthus anomalus]
MNIRIRKLYLFYSYRFLLQVFSCYCVIQMLLLLFSLQQWIFELICMGKLPCFIMHPRCSTKCLRENVVRLLIFFNALLGACVSAKKFDNVDGCESGHCFGCSPRGVMLQFVSDSRNLEVPVLTRILIQRVKLCIISNGSNKKK